ncbi:hypothetical protein OX283_009455 [Flavobacterium sp. SUN052]|uniref:hypothetical protein n=1 Tax=Flavobacterium sp. SUN052 TaxID=3002441 RepID=UPI00237D81F8|nr:hypothetical protein [Flavobacterium sp. SUN052]MEC4004880.1 hypothetical protein [Flavobacterium sp. SUN052]
MKTKIITLLFLIALLLNSCISLQLVPSYSETIEKQIIETQKLNEKMYTEILALPESKRNYENFEKQYIEIESNINSLFFQINNREQNSDFVVMMSELKTNFIQYKEEHKSKGTLKDGEINIYIKYINDFYKPILISEKALKTVKK